MKTRIKRIELIGGGREVSFKAGLNIISGGTTSGKTTLIRLIRGLFGGSYEDMIPEVRRYVSDVQGEIVIGSEDYIVVRPATGSEEARVDIAGSDFVARLPVYETKSGLEQTYARWLVGQLGLPHVQVPVSQNPDVPLSPVSINDWFLYCHLKWQEIDTMVMGHDHPYKDRKRRVVFRLLYRLYNPETLQLQAQLRDLEADFRQSRSEGSLLERTLATTPFGNRAEIVRQIDRIRHRLQDLGSENNGLPEPEEGTSPIQPQTQQLRSSILRLDREASQLAAAVEDEEGATTGLQELLNQLLAQSRRITKSITASNYLLDFDFHQCPRCGTGVAPDRISLDHCYLCLQVPTGAKISREDLVKEQLRLDAQIAETRELIEARENTAAVLKERVERVRRERVTLAQELDFVTRAYVSDHVEHIRSRAAERATLLANLQALQGNLEVHDRVSQFRSRTDAITREIEILRARIDESLQGTEQAGDWFRYLNETFRETLVAFEAPHIGEDHATYIDRNTYLPVFDGRTFDSLSSPGLIVQINVAHAIAHHLTSIQYGLQLPAILLIDGFTSNLANQGLARNRKDRMYEHLIHLSEQVGDELQIIVADDDVPDWAQAHVSVTLSEHDRLVRPPESDQGQLE